MFCVKVLVLLILHMAFSKHVWHVYVDLELYLAIGVRFDGINLISAIKQAFDVDINCPNIRADQETSDSISFPCAYLHSVIPANYDAQPPRIWTIMSPSVFWIELTIITLELPLSGPQCTYGHVAFLNLIGEPPDVKYCGRRPRQILYASSKLTIEQYFLLLSSELRISLEYQYVTKYPFAIRQRLPYVINSYIQKDCENAYNCETFMRVLQLGDIPYHKIYDSGIVRYHVLYIPRDVNEKLVNVLLKAGECNYIIYNGPGIYAPIKASSSTHGPVYSMAFDHQVFMELWGALDKCQNTSIDHRRDRNWWFDSQHNHITLQNGRSEPTACSGTNYHLKDGNYEFHTLSSDEINTWCRLLVKFKAGWTIAMEIEFNGANNFLQCTGNSTCQFGGVFISDTMSANDIRKRSVYSFCESVSVQPETINTILTTKIYIRFYAGYSAGKVKLRVMTTDVLPLSLNLVPGRCALSFICAGNTVHIWKDNSYVIDEFGEIQDKTKYVFFDTVPFWYAYLVDETTYVKDFHVRITSGARDNSVMLGLVHFLLSLQCSGRSICETECSIGASMLQENTIIDEYRYKGSVDIDKYVVYARIISLSIKVQNVTDVQLKVSFEKIQTCNITGTSQYAQQLPNNDCNIIKVKQSLGYAHFLTQITQDLSIGLNPECPVKECVNINVKLISLISFPYGEVYEWENTALEHVPIKLQSRYYAAVFLAWTHVHSEQCSASYNSILQLCDVWVNVEAQIRFDELPKYNNIIKRPEGILENFLPHANQLHFYKT